MSEQATGTKQVTGDLTRFLFSRLDDVVVALDADDRIVHASAGWTAAFGQHSVADDPFSDWLAPEDRDAFRRALTTARSKACQVITRPFRVVHGTSTTAHDISMSIVEQGEQRLTVVSLVSHEEHWTDAGGALVRAWLPMLDRLQHHTSNSELRVVVVRIAPDLIRELEATAGVEARDEVLSTLARRLRANLGTCHAIGQAGPDDVMIVRWSVDPDQIVGITERLESAVEEATQSPITVGGHVFVPRAHCGVAIGNGSASAVELVRDATHALRHARRTSRRWQVHEAMFTNGVTLLQTCMLVDAAVQRREIDVAFQPIHETEHGNVVGVEALARFRGALGGADVGSIIADAEATGSIAALGEQVIERAVSTVAGWHDWHGYLAVNVSPVQLGQRMFVSALMHILEDFDFPASRLVVEVTESALLDDVRSVETLQRLRELGVRVAIDDFGTGHSSISRLHQLPIDILKVDRDFVRTLPSPTAEAIVRTVVALASALDVDVVAEGVELPHQLDLLRSIGTTHVQGYLLGMPVLDFRPPADEALEPNPPFPRLCGGMAHDHCFMSSVDQSAIVEFVMDGLETDDRITCVLEAERIDLIRHGLAAEGVDVDVLESAGRLVLVDGEAMLETLLDLDGSLDLDRVRATVESVITPDPRWGGIRLYGEMVGILWSRGQLVSALELERAWCDVLATAPSISLRCGYPVEVIGMPADLAAIRAYHD